MGQSPETGEIKLRFGPIEGRTSDDWFTKLSKDNARAVFNGTKPPGWPDFPDGLRKCVAFGHNESQVFATDLSEYWCGEHIDSVFNTLLPKLVSLSKAEAFSMAFKGAKTSATAEEVEEHKLEAIFLEGKKPSKKQAAFIEKTKISVVVLVVATKTELFSWDAERTTGKDGVEKIGRWRKATVDHPACWYLQSAMTTPLPAGLSLCLTCGLLHEPGTPHNRDSPVYIKWFHEKFGRYPTWEDACSDCLPGMKDRMLEMPKEKGVDTKGSITLH